MKWVAQFAGLTLLVAGFLFGVDARASTASPVYMFASKLLAKDFSSAKSLLVKTVGRNPRQPSKDGSFSMTADEFVSSIESCEVANLETRGSNVSVRIVMKCGYEGIGFEAISSGEQVFISDYGPTVFVPPPPVPASSGDRK